MTDLEKRKRKKSDPYQEGKQVLTEYFAPKHHQGFECLLFCTMKPTDGESMGQIGQSALNQATKCTFGATEQEPWGNRVIGASISFALTECREKLLHERDLKQDPTMKICKAYETIKYQGNSWC